MLFDTNSTLTAQASLDALWIKTQVISNNLANVDTPGFKASNVTFEQALSRAREVQTLDGSEAAAKRAASSGRYGLQTIDGQAQDAGRTSSVGRWQANVSTDNTSSMREDGNNVSLEQQQTELWKTYAQYSYLLDRVSGHYRNINAAISGMKL